MINVAYVIAFSVSMVFAILGYVMLSFFPLFLLPCDDNGTDRIFGASHLILKKVRQPSLVRDHEGSFENPRLSSCVDQSRGLDGRRQFSLSW